jgi:hypothetical protein
LPCLLLPLLPDPAHGAAARNNERLGFRILRTARLGHGLRRNPKTRFSPYEFRDSHSIGPYEAPGRTVAAFLIAPLTVPVLFNGIAVLSDVYTSRTSPSGLLDGLLFFTLYSLPFAYFAEGSIDDLTFRFVDA